MPYTAAICDDSAPDAIFVREILEAWAKERQLDICIEIFPSAESFLFRYADQKSYDLLLLDIEMGAMDGVSLARRVRRDNAQVQIIFITGYSDYISEGYEVEALHYLVKPVNQKKLFMVLDRAVERLAQNARCLNLELSGEMVRLPLYEIRYLEVHHNYVTIHARSDYTVKRSLGAFEELLGSEFYRVSRNMIVNLKAVRRVTRSEMYLSDGSVLPLPRGAYEPLNRAIIAKT